MSNKQKVRDFVTPSLMLASLSGGVLAGACFGLFGLSTAWNIGLGVLSMAIFNVGSVIAHFNVQKLRAQKQRLELQLAIRERKIKSLERSKGKEDVKGKGREAEDALAAKAAQLDAASRETSATMIKLRKRFNKKATVEEAHTMRDLDEAIRLEAHKEFIINGREDR